MNKANTAAFKTLFAWTQKVKESEQSKNDRRQDIAASEELGRGSEANLGEAEDH